jgi:hypothetical protein
VRYVLKSLRLAFQALSKLRSFCSIAVRPFNAAPFLQRGQCFSRAKVGLFVNDWRVSEHDR